MSSVLKHRYSTRQIGEKAPAQIRSVNVRITPKKKTGVEISTPTTPTKGAMRRLATDGSSTPRGSTTGTGGGISSPRGSTTSAGGGISSPRGSKTGAGHGISSPRGSTTGASGGISSPRGATTDAGGGLSSPKDSLTGAGGGTSDNDENQDFDHFSIQGNMEMSIKKSREKRKLERLEQEVVILKKDIKKLKKKVHKLENKQASENQSDGGELQLSGLNFKTNNLKNAVKGMFDAQQALNHALRDLLSLEEIRNSSITGGKIVKCGEDGPIPPLDQEKLRLLKEIIHEKFPSFTRKKISRKNPKYSKSRKEKIASDRQL